MSRTIIDNPLQGAAPTLQPTSRPYAVPIGATQAKRSPLADLGKAFESFNPTLTDMLRTRAAQEDQDAESLGVLKAQELSAAGRLNEVETTLKSMIDSGALPAFRGPAFERGLRARVGSELAKTGFQEDLMSQLADASRVSGGGSSR